MQADVQHIKSI